MTLEKLSENYSELKIKMRNTRTKNRRDKNLIKLREELYQLQDNIVSQMVSEKREIKIDY